jgi:Rha family phage regulatory protein
MYEVGQLPETHLVGTNRRVIWHDDLARFKQLGQTETCRPSNVLRRINQLRAKHPEAKGWFITCDGRVGVTRKGFALLAARWDPEQRLAIDGVYSKAIADARRENAGGKNMQDDQQKAHEPEPEEMPDGEAIPPEAEPEVEQVHAEADDDDAAPGPTQSPVVYNKDQETLTTSLAVAKAYGKAHKHVIRDIDRILDPGPHLGPAFVFRKTTYLDRQGQARPMYEMNQNAFVLLVGGFTGEKALQLRIAYISEFERMKAALKDKAPGHDLERLVAGLAKAVTDAIAGIPGAINKAMEERQASSGESRPQKPRSKPRYDTNGLLTIDLFCQEHNVDFDWFCQFTGPGAVDDKGVKQFGLGLLYLSDNGKWRVTGSGLQSRLFADHPFFTESYGKRVDRTYAKLTKQGEAFFKSQLARMASTKGADLFGNVIRPRSWQKKTS